jgi:integrase/recombinase XerD
VRGQEITDNLVELLIGLVHKIVLLYRVAEASLEHPDETYLFKSSWRNRYSDRGVRRMLERYAAAAGLERNVSPHQLRHFLFTWLKKQGIDDALIQPYSGHASRQSLEIYSRLAIAEAQQEYDHVIGRFSV